MVEPLSDCIIIEVGKTAKDRIHLDVANPIWASTQYNPRIGSRHDFLA
jgi:hypothetical protein